MILMHSRGRSADMYARAVYGDVGTEVAAELAARAAEAVTTGIDRRRIILDPGLGFAKRAEHSYAVLARLDTLAALDRPILSGPSRKSFLKSAIGDRAPDERELSTAAAVTASVLYGAHIVRVHGVAAMVDVVRTADLILHARA